MRNSEKLALPPDAGLTPLAVSLSGATITNIVVRTRVNSTDYYTLLTGPEFTPSGWAPDDSLVVALVAKRGFLPISADAPVLHLETVIEDVHRLEQWLEG